LKLILDNKGKKLVNLIRGNNELKLFLILTYIF